MEKRRKWNTVVRNHESSVGQAAIDFLILERNSTTDLYALYILFTCRNNTFMIYLICCDVA